MAYLLRTLIILMLLGILLTALTAMNLLSLPISHIKIAIPAYLYTIFAQAFVMFYFIGTSRLLQNIHEMLTKKVNLNEIFENPPEDLSPYLHKVGLLAREAQRHKKKNIPWSILVIILGMIAFLLGGAHDTHLVSKTTHSGVVLGFIVAMIIGLVNQWISLGKCHLLLRKIKALFQIPDGQM